LLEYFSVIEAWSKTLKAASLEPYRVIVDLIDDVISSLGRGFLGVVGYDEKPKAAGETKVICRTVGLLQLGDIAVVHVSVCPGHGETVAKAHRTAQRCRRKAAEPYRRMRFLDRLGRDPNVLEIEKLALEGDGFAGKSAANDVERLVGPSAAILGGHAET
jgi:hypothetical protein